MSALVPLHALLGVAGSLLFLWAALELRRPGTAGLARAHIATVLGLLALLFSWALGGWYYITVYGPAVKPLIKDSWAHGVAMESKEHIFLLLPFLAALEVALLRTYWPDLGRMRKTAVLLALAIALIGALVAAEGYLVSSAARAALEVGA